MTRLVRPVLATPTLSARLVLLATLSTDQNAERTALRPTFGAQARTTASAVTRSARNAQAPLLTTALLVQMGNTWIRATTPARLVTRLAPNAPGRISTSVPPVTSRPTKRRLARQSVEFGVQLVSTSDLTAQTAAAIATSLV